MFSTYHPIYIKSNNFKDFRNKLEYTLIEYLILLKNTTIGDYQNLDYIYITFLQDTKKDKSFTINLKNVNFYKKYNYIKLNDLYSLKLKMERKIKLYKIISKIC